MTMFDEDLIAMARKPSPPMDPEACHTLLSIGFDKAVGDDVSVCVIFQSMPDGSLIHRAQADSLPAALRQLTDSLEDR